MTLRETFGDSARELRGFTALELIIVIAITVALLASVAPLYGNFQVSSQLNDAAAQIGQTLRTARERSAARVNNSSHGVLFDEDRYVLYQGASYTGRTREYDREVILGEALRISADFPLPWDVNFSKGLGVPGATGMITITHVAGGTRTITVSLSGKVEEL